MKEEVIAIFDIGKTNKKLLLFNFDLKLLSESEEKFGLIRDEDGFECDNIDQIEKWIKKSVTDLAGSDNYDLKAVNFTTYGASLVYLDSSGKRLAPVYNYLKPIDEAIPESIYRKYGGSDEFCRKTASPALGMLNSGFQALWLKRIKPEIFLKVKHILHFPQYLSYTLTGKIYSEHTSIGCHTALWDFDKMDYHQWTSDEGLILPSPVPVSTVDEIVVEKKKIKVGIGIHDSSSSLAPYFSGSDKKFLLLSTGTWCINMNPFNSEILTSDQLSKDSLCYLSVTRQPVKSSRLFLGNLHETAVKLLSSYFRVNPESFKMVKPNSRILSGFSEKFGDEKIFFPDGKFTGKLEDDIDLFVFNNFVEGYHQLMIELSNLTVNSIDLIIPEDDDTEIMFITGGFSENELFLRLIASSYPHKKVYTSEINNATALGAALVIIESLGLDKKPLLNLGLNEIILSK